MDKSVCFMPMLQKKKKNEITKLLDFSGYIELLLWFDYSNKLLAINIFIINILIYI